VIHLNILLRKKQDKKGRKRTSVLYKTRGEVYRNIGSKWFRELGTRVCPSAESGRTRILAQFFTRLIGRRSVSKGFVLIRVTCL